MALLTRRCPVRRDIVVTAATVHVTRIGGLVTGKTGDALKGNRQKRFIPFDKSVHIRIELEVPFFFFGFF